MERYLAFTFSISLTETVMLKPDFERREQHYNQLLLEYQSLEAKAPLTAADAVKYGGEKFKCLMRLEVEAGRYPSEWIEAANQLLKTLQDWVAEGQRQWSTEQYDALLGLEDDLRQIHPVCVLAQVPPSPITHPDTLADQLAEGTTPCELF